MIRRLICHVTPGKVRAELRRGRSVLWAAEADWESLEVLSEVVAELAGRAELPVWGRSVRFVLADQLVQRRELSDLPPVGRTQLAALVALAPQRYFRRNGTPLVCDAGWTGPRTARVAVAVAAEIPFLQAVVRGAAEAGLVVESIE
ncbi:MAG TPA: hypothetical protein VF454_01725, partial [Gemmatimonadales bacterium]